MSTTAAPTNNPLATQRGGGPLTTVFSTPEFCAPIYWTDTVTPPLASIVCMPPQWKQVFDYRWGYYSPGICPLGYTEGCAFPTPLATVLDGDPQLGGPVIPSETARLCCPTGHTCYTDKPWAYSKCLSTVPYSTYYDISNKPQTELATVFAVQVRWQASDLSILQTDPTVPGSTYDGPRPTSSAAGASAGVTASGTSTITPAASAMMTTSTATPESLDNGSSPPSSGGISVGTTVAIAVGAVAGTLALAAIAFLLYWRRRRRKEATRVNSGNDSDAWPPPAMAAYKKGGGSSKPSLELLPPGTAVSASTTMLGGLTPSTPSAATQLDSTTLLEMEAMERPQELPEDNMLVELEGDMPGPPLYREKEGFPLR